MEGKIPTNFIVDPETGEIVSTVYAGDQLTIRRSAQDEYIATHVLDFNKDKTFVKIYDDVVPLLEKYLSMAEFRLAICLAPHVSYEDCIIREYNDRKSKILSIKDLAEIHNYKYDYLKKLMSSLKRKGLIGKHETGSIIKDYAGRYGTAYTVNPYVYFRGSDINIPIYSFYEASGWKELLINNETTGVKSESN